jgi:hypothetical protein
MTLYREGTLLRDCTGGLWIVLGYCRHPHLPKSSKMPNAYDVVSLECGFRYTPVFRLAHSDFEVVSEVQ